jgi:hypothetical protein
MICRQLEAWNRFFRGRIAQEQGRKEDVLREFRQAFEIDPDDQCFRDATKVAQRNLHRNLSPLEEHLLMHVQQGYEELAQTLTSQKDEQVKGLKQILAELEGRPPIDGYVRTYKGGLLCGWSKGRKVRSCDIPPQYQRLSSSLESTLETRWQACTWRACLVI